MDDNNVGSAKARTRNHVGQLYLREAQVQVGIKIARFLKVMAVEIKNHQLATRAQHPVRLMQRILRVDGMVQALAEQREIHRRRLNRQFFKVAQPVFKVLHPLLLGGFAPVRHHLLGIIDGNHALRALGEQKRQRTLPCPDVDDLHRRQQLEQRFRDGLP
jgi:hypothetical protein